MSTKSQLEVGLRICVPFTQCPHPLVRWVREPELPDVRSHRVFFHRDWRKPERGSNQRERDRVAETDVDKLRNRQLKSG